MMTINALDSVKQARSYYSAERGIASYYSSEANAYGGGQWYGRGAEKLGLRGPVHEKQWSRALEGKFGKGKDAMQVGNPDPEQRRPGVDLTFSPPKSVSIMALAVGDDRLIGAHDRAVERTMARIEAQQVFARMKHGGAKKVLTGNLCAALYRHVTSRPVNGVTDPQLHTHAVVLNVTERPDGQWVSVNLGMSRDWIKAYGAIYRMELAKEIRALGYELYETKDGFEIQGVTREFIELFSGRAGQVVDELTRRGKTRESASAAEKNGINLKNRHGKEQKDGAELRGEWRGRAEAAGLAMSASALRTARPVPTGEGASARVVVEDKEHPPQSARSLDQIHAGAVARGPLPPPDASTVQAIATEGVQAAVRHLAERESAFEHDAILIAAERFIPAGLVTGHDLSRAITRESDAYRLLPATEGRYTTAEAIMREKEFIARIKDGRGAVSPIVSDTPAVFTTSDGKTLNAGQANAAKHILGSPDRFVAVQGVSGGGKTTAMQVVREQAEAAGYKVVGMAPTHRAARELRNAGVASVYTVARATASMPQEIDDKTLILVDESSMISATDMADLAEKIEASGARAAFVGDTRQLQAVEAGAPFRQMQDHAATSVLDEIQRQKNLELKAAVEAFAAGRSAKGADLAKAFMRQADFSVLKDEYGVPIQFHSRTAEHEAYAGVIAQEAAAEFLSRPDAAHELSQTMVITGTNSMREAVNLNVREGLQERGDLGREDKAIGVLQTIDLTREQIRHVGSYKLGCVVEFRRDYESRGVSAPVERGRQYQITKIDRDHNKITLADRENGQKIEWSPRIAGKAGMSEKKDLVVSERERVVFRASDEARGIVNGDRGTIMKIEGDKITVTTDRGATLDLRRGDHVQHAYASTVHSAQGATCDHEITAATSWSPTATAEQGYVSLSRARESAVVITDSIEGLAEKWAEPKPKETAHEVCLSDRDPEMEREEALGGRERDVVDGRDRDTAEKEQKENRPGREQEQKHPATHQEPAPHQEPARGRGIDLAIDAIASRLSAGGAAAMENFRESMDWVRDEIKHDLARGVDSLLTTQPAGGAHAHNIDAMAAEIVNGIGARLVEAVRGERGEGHSGGDGRSKNEDEHPRREHLRPDPGPRLEDQMAAVANAIAERIAKDLKAALASKKEHRAERSERSRHHHGPRLESQLTATANAVAQAVADRAAKEAKPERERTRETPSPDLGRSR